ncbi:hypothetical protein C8R45DRAFT_1097401 [Mycena sanguinolenta]|nr:hypothetical protein C8R45DRAFT_1097401 [Mycena sanguinolenta]
MTKVFRVLSTVTVVATLAAVTWAAPQATVTTSTPNATPSGACIPEYCQCGGIGWTTGQYPGCDTCAPGLTCFVNNPYYWNCYASEE